MKIPIAAALALAACATLPADHAPASLAAAETAFAAQSVREDMRAAFLANFAPNGVLVRDGWRRADEWLGPRPAPPIVLDWRPVHVETATSGELGISTGPWRVTPRGGTAPEAYGQFVSVWIRENRGPWRVAVDLGISHPEPALWDAPLQTHTTPAQLGAGSIDEAESAFAKLSAVEGAAAAWRRWAAADLRFYREGHAPWLGLAAASPNFDDARLAWSPDGSAIAGSGDLGYVRGTVRDAASGAITGHYLRVWRREGPGWRVALDVVSPAAKR